MAKRPPDSDGLNFDDRSGWVPAWARQQHAEVTIAERVYRVRYGELR
jgi:hypothetical protein